MRFLPYATTWLAFFISNLWTMLSPNLRFPLQESKTFEIDASSYAFHILVANDLEATTGSFKLSYIVDTLAPLAWWFLRNNIKWQR